MAVTNHERVGKALTLVRDAIRPEVERIWRGQFGNRWLQQVSQRISHHVGAASPDDLAFLLRGMDATWDQFFRQTQSRSTRSYLNLLWDARNDWAHNKRFDSDHTLRILDHCEMMLQAFQSGEAAEEVQELKRSLRRQVLAEERRTAERRAATGATKGEPLAGLKPWREVIAPHPDVREGRFAQAEFAADLRQYVQDRLGGIIARPDGKLVPGPQVRWVGRRHGPRKDRRWATSWSPAQISNRLRIDFPHNESMRISHEAIYQALYVQGRGALKRELVACLRTGRALRVPRARTQRRGRKFVSPQLMISQRPAEADDRAVPGHWEGDLILGLHSSAIGTLVERTTRFTMLLHLPRMPGHGQQQPVKNGPPLAGHGAQAVRDAIAESITTLPEQLRKSLTWDQGTEMAQHAQLRIDTNLDIYFCDPQAPWQRGTNENTNGLLRQYFPKGTDLSRHSRDDLDAVAAALNSRPRKTLDWKTPAETLNEHLHSLKQGSVATTP